MKKKQIGNGQRRELTRTRARGQRTTQQHTRALKSRPLSWSVISVYETLFSEERATRWKRAAKVWQGTGEVQQTERRRRVSDGDEWRGNEKKAAMANEVVVCSRCSVRTPKISVMLQNRNRSFKRPKREGKGRYTRRYKTRRHAERKSAARAPKQRRNVKPDIETLSREKKGRKTSERTIPDLRYEVCACA